MDVFIIGSLRAGFVVLLHSAGTVGLQKCARLHRLLNRKCMFFYRKWVQVVCTLLWVPSRWDLKSAELTKHSVVPRWQCLLDRKQSGPDIPESCFFFFLLQSENESRATDLGLGRTIMASLEFTGRVLVSMHQRLTGSWAPDDHPLLHISAPLLAVRRRTAAHIL